MAMDNARYELDDMLAQGFRDSESLQVYESLKETYEEETGDTEFSTQELTGKLDYIINQQDYDWSFQSLPHSIFSDYMILVGKLYLINKNEGIHYLKQLDFADFAKDKEVV